EPLCGVQYRVMLDRRRNDVIALARQTEQRHVVGFGSAAHEDNFCRTRVEQRCYGSARFLHGCARVLSEVMDRRRIAELFEIERLHRRQNFRQNRSGGVVVEIYTLHTSILRSVQDHALTESQVAVSAWWRLLRSSGLER